MIKKILTHLNIFKDEKNQRVPPLPEKDYAERVKIVPFEDGWPEYEEVVFEFIKSKDCQWIRLFKIRLNNGEKTASHTESPGLHSAHLKILERTPGKR